MHKTDPLVSIICISHNHEKFVCEALDSVIGQTYLNIELVILDDYSTDNSVQQIKEWIKKRNLNPIFIQNQRRLGVTTSFNTAFRQSSGTYIVDLAADDILLPNFVYEHIINFQNTQYTNPGVSYCNVEFVTENLEHSDYQNHDKREFELMRRPTQGMIYKDIVRLSFFNPIGLMSKREVYEKLNGYDESLAFEDLDYWIRSSRHYEYIYVPKVLAQKRVLSFSLTTSIRNKTPYRKEMQASFARVCEKIFHLNRTREEYIALLPRIRLLCRWFIKSGNVKVILRLFFLYLRTCKKIFWSYGIKRKFKML